MSLPETFSQTCDKPYDRHLYTLVYENGKEKIFESWEQTQMTWFQHGGVFLSHIEVLDIKKKKTKSGGFK